MVKEIMTARQLAKYLQLNEATIYKLARSGEMPASRVGRSWRFRKDLIDHWLKRDAGVKAELVLHKGVEGERRYPLLSSVITLGTDQKNEIVLSGEHIFAQHALIVQENGRHMIISLDSTRGISVNGKAIERQVLEDGDEIKLGETILVFQEL